MLVLLLSSCTIIRQGEVGVVRKNGRFTRVLKEPGAHGKPLFTAVVLKLPLRTVNRELRITLPSKEGLNVECEMSILYHLQADSALSILEKLGLEYEEVAILPVFRSAAADVSARFLAKDMHTAQRAAIEGEVRDLMMKYLAGRGIVIEAVLMKSVRLPEGLYNAIEEKLQAEQQAQRMEFVLQRERQEAERRKIEAEGIRESNQILAASLTPALIQYLSIQAFEKLSASPGTKVIMTDGKAPFLIDDGK